MMFSNDRNRFFFWSLILLLLSIFLSTKSAVAQMRLEPRETILLYEKTQYTEQVPIVTCIDLERGGQLLAVGGDDHQVRLWDIDKKTFVLSLQEHVDWVRGLAFSPDRTQLATVGQDGQIKLWNAHSGRLIHSLKNPIRGTQQIVYHPDGSKFAVCGYDREVRIHDAKTGNLLQSLVAPGTSNRAMAFSPDGSILAVGGRTGVVRLWRVEGGEKVADIPGDGRRVNAIAFSADGSKIATGGEGPFLLLWNAEDGRLFLRFPERAGKTFSLAFCGENRLASGESDNVIRLWDLETRRQSATLFGHTGTISTMIYEASKGELITGSFDASIRFWSMDALPTESTLSETPVISPSTPMPETFPVDLEPAIASPIVPFAFE